MNALLQTCDLIRPGFKANCLQQMRIVIDVQSKLSGKEDLISMSIKNSIDKNTPATVIIREIKEMAEDNFNTIAFLLGNDLTNEIMKQ